MKSLLMAAAGGIGGSALYQTVIKPYLDGMKPRDLEASLSRESAKKSHGFISSTP